MHEWRLSKQNKAQVMAMIVLLMFYMLLFLAGSAIYGFYKAIQGYFLRTRVSRFIEIVEYRQDFLFLSHREFVQLVVEVLRRKGYNVRLTNGCGEYENGLELNGLQYVEVFKTGLHDMIEVETAMKLAWCMRRNQVFRGLIVALGGFKHNTRYYCYNHVISCMDGNELLSLCREVRNIGRAPEWEENNSRFI
ncbi:MAG: hypothetical protein GX027_03650 [Clostridiaceae bacterium]|jgi:restriction system protein|nr:hypothetical protein [Clostridiaceae bacterium]